VDDLATDLVRCGDYRALGNLGVTHEDALDVERPDAVASHQDHVVVAAGEADQSVGTDRGEVAGQIVLAVSGEWAADVARGAVSGEGEE